MPIVEIALLLQVGDVIGGWNTVAVVIITAFLGATLVRQQGLQTFMSAQGKMRNGELPSQEMAEGLLLLVAGVLLVTPGFVTDGIGFLFTLPFTRPFFAKYLAKTFFDKVKMQNQFTFTNADFSQHQQHHHNPNTPPSHNNPFSKDDIIEGEYSKKNEPQSENLINNQKNSDQPNQNDK